MTSSSVSSSSSQISTDTSSSSLLPSENENYESQKYDIFENLFDSDSDSGRDEISEHPQRDTLQMAVDFFTEFASMPDIDAVSEDIEHEPEITIPPTEFSKIKSQDKDLGYFVHPLTGDRLFSTVNVATPEIQDSDASEPKAFDSNETLESINEDIGSLELSDVDITLDLVEYTEEKDQDLNRNIEEDKTLEQFLETGAIKLISTEDNEDLKWEALAREEEAKCLQRNVMDLVDEIIREVIQTSEYISPDALRRQHLDKRKLMREILNKVQESEVEKRIRQFLNQKCVDFYRRKKKFRPIMPDNKKSLQFKMQNYSQAIKRLDKMLSKELQTKERAMQMKQELETQLNNAKNKCQEAIADFEDLVRTNLMRDDRPKCNMVC